MTETNIRASGLVPRMTWQGVEVDVCPETGAVWFERGEILFLARDRRSLDGRLRNAGSAGSAGSAGPLSERRSPRTGEPMKQLDLPNIGRFWRCAQSGGLWFDKPELDKLIAAFNGIKLDLIETSESAAPGSGSGDIELMSLPFMAVRSLFTLAGMYALLGLFLIVAVWVFDLPAGFVVLIAATVSLFHFAIGPSLLSLVLNIFYRIDWVEPEQLPDHLRDFSIQLANAQAIKVPRFGIIDDGAPQAFTYGHTPNNARIVISRGLLELLEPDEVEAVVGHEFGHAVHWDMFLMTVAQVAPLVFYFFCQLLLSAMRRTSGRKSKGGAAILPFFIFVFVLYIISQYVLLAFSRTRELHADRFAGEATGRPGSLASALVKIAYGLAEPAPTTDDEEMPSMPRSNIATPRALGIFDEETALNLVAAGQGIGATGDVRFDPETLKSTMRWDKWNPWARWYEAHSTHPLTARRLEYLANQSEAMGQSPLVRFDYTPPESYWDEFFFDLCIHLLPYIGALGAAIVIAVPSLLYDLGARFYYVEASSFFYIDTNVLCGTMILAFGAGLLIRLLVTYGGNRFDDMSVAALLKRVKVSAVRPVPCTLRGTIIGRGVPGLVYSEDFVLQDPTGIMFLDVRQPLHIWEVAFGAAVAEEYQGRNVTVEGWYRRAPVPFVEVKRLISGRRTTKSWARHVKYGFAVVIAGAGMYVLLARPFY